MDAEASALLLPIVDAPRAVRDPFPEFPAELKSRHRFVCWERRPNPKDPAKPRKVPMRADRSGGEASSTDPATWGSYSDAIQALDANPRRAGIGIVFAEEDRDVGVDLDDCINPATGELAEWARPIVTSFADTYQEISPSGTGLHILTRGVLPSKDRKRGKIEMYSAGRYFTVTGRRYGSSPAAVAACQAAIDALHAAHLARPTTASAQPSLRIVPPAATMVVSGSDARALLDNAFASKHGSRIRALYAGDTSAHGNDHSSADLALASHLLYWTGGDTARADRLFRESGLMRPKWDERHGAQTYGERTLERAAVQSAERDVYPRRDSGRAGRVGR